MSDLVLYPPNDLAKKLRMPLSEIQKLVQIVCKEVAQQLDDESRHRSPSDACFTTGDEILDEAIGGGIRTNMVWEFCGERCVVSVLRRS